MINSNTSGILNKKEGSKKEKRKNKKESEESFNTEPVKLPEVAVYPPGFHEDNLKDYARELNNSFSNPDGKRFTEREKSDVIKTLWKNINQDWVYKNNPENFTDTAWSAATISNMVMKANNVKTPEELRSMGFRTSAAHKTYIDDAFRTKNDPNYKYNMYTATRFEDSDNDFQVGDIFFNGRGDNEKWEFDDFDGHDDNQGYSSHTDIVIEVGEDKKGKYVVTAGGNRGNKDYKGLLKKDRENSETFRTSKYYVDKLPKRYKGMLKRKRT